MSPHIVCFDCFPAWGGGQGKLSRRMQKLVSLGYQVSLICPAGSPFHTTKRPANVTVIGIAMGERLTDWSGSQWSLGALVEQARLTAELWRLFRVLRPQLIDALGSRSAKVVLPAAYLARVPLTWSAGNLYQPGWSDRLLLRYSNAVVCASQTIREQYVPVTNQREKLHVVFNSVEVAKHEQADRTKVRRELGLRQDDVLVGVVGRISEPKGQLDFVQAISPLMEIHPELHAAIVGDALPQDRAYWESIEAHVSASQIKSRFHLLGWRDDIPEIMKALDLLVLSSHSEPFGYVLIEAMAAEKPIIATNAGSVREIVIQDETGLLVPPKDVTAMRQAIEQLLISAQERARLGEAGLRRARQLFNEATALSQYAEIIQSVVQS